MRCKTKQRKGSRLDTILGYRRITADENSQGIRRNLDEMNDHPSSTLVAKCWADRIRLIAIKTMEGAFGNEGALPSFTWAKPLLSLVERLCESRLISCFVLTMILSRKKLLAERNRAES